MAQRLNEFELGERRFRFVRTGGAEAVVTIEADKPEGTPVQAELFGNFFEHLGFAVQGGVLAQLLRNPSFYPHHNLSERDLRTLKENGRTMELLHRLSDEERRTYSTWRPHVRCTGFGLMILDDDTQNGVPLPWRITPEGAGRGNAPGRVGHAVVLRVREEGVSLRQGVFAPHRRERRYEGHIWVKATGAGALRVEFRRRGGSEEVLAQKEFPWPGDLWTKLHFELVIPEGLLHPLEPVDFCITAHGTGRLWVDRAVLLPADHIEGFDPEVVQAARRLAPPVLRGPGGNFVSGYHFWHGIGDIDLRQTFPNDAWGGIEDNFLGIDEFLRFCELIGAEPHICVNMGDGCAEEAAAWVEYVNGPPDSRWGKKRAQNGRREPYNVKWWEIGNEIYGPWQIGHCGADENARRYREWAEAMRAVDPSIKLIATGNFADFIEPHHHWHEILLEQGGPDVECISLHALPNNVQEIAPDTAPEQLWNALMAHTARWETIDLPALKALAGRLRPDREITVAVTEWGILGDPGKPHVCNIGGAVYAALFLNMAMRMKEFVVLANATAILHGGCIRKAGTIVYTDPQVEVIRRHTLLAGSRLLPVAYEGPGYDIEEGKGARTAPRVPGVPSLDVVSVKLPDGSYQAVIVNRHATEAVRATVRIRGIAKAEVTSCEAMVATGFNDVNTPLAPERVAVRPAPYEADGGSVRLELPARSITWLAWVDRG